MIDAEERRVVAMEYPIQAITASSAPTIMSIDNCITMGLHSESISKYAYVKKPPMHSMNIIRPPAFRLSIELYLQVPNLSL